MRYESSSKFADKAESARRASTWHDGPGRPLDSSRAWCKRAQFVLVHLGADDCDRCADSERQVVRWPRWSRARRVAAPYSEQVRVLPALADSGGCFVAARDRFAIDIEDHVGGREPRPVGANSCGTTSVMTAPFVAGSTPSWRAMSGVSVWSATPTPVSLGATDATTSSPGARGRSASVTWASWALPLRSYVSETLPPTGAGYQADHVRGVRDLVPADCRDDVPCRETTGISGTVLDDLTDERSRVRARVLWGIAHGHARYA